MNPTPELAAALAAVQAELPPVLKNRTADTGKYTYDYADLADVSAAVMPVLGRHGLAFTGFPGHHDGKFGLRYYLLHSAGGWIDGFFEIDDKGGMQLVGGRITYARRYCLCAVVGVAAEDDVDARGDGQHAPRTAQRKPRTQSTPPARAVPPRAAASAGSPSFADAGGALPPLPGEEDAPGPAEPGNQPVPGPGAPDAVTPKQLTAIWTVLSEVFLFGKDERDEARKVCAHVVNRELASSTNLTKQEAATVLDTLAHWESQAQREDEKPRAYLQMMIDATGGETGE